MQCEDFSQLTINEVCGERKVIARDKLG